MAAVPTRGGYEPPDDPAPDGGPPQAWDPTSVHRPDTPNTPDPGTVPPPPAVPSGGGTGKEAVNTASMDAFAKNIAALVPHVVEARNKMASGTASVVHPGAFYDAYQLRSQTSGPNGGAGLQQRYYNVLDDLAEGLQDISTGMQQLSKKHSTTEELNRLKTSDLLEALGNASADFQRLGNDSGATVSSTGGSSTTTGNQTGGTGGTTKT